MATITKCASQVFTDWVVKVDNILSQLPKTDMSGEPLEYQDEAYQEVMQLLQQASMNFEDMPIYPINEAIANKLIQDQQRGADERPDL
tara:strand:- start:1060 stop:1323 length:264 start_codon:yes stop_codon:yes gene_type:complete